VSFEKKIFSLFLFKICFEKKKFTKKKFKM